MSSPRICVDASLTLKLALAKLDKASHLMVEVIP